MKSFVVILLYKSEIIVEIAATELGNFNAMGIIGFQGIRNQGAALNYQSQGRRGCHMDSMFKVAIRII